MALTAIAAGMALLLDRASKLAVDRLLAGTVRTRPPPALYLAPVDNVQPAVFGRSGVTPILLLLAAGASSALAVEGSLYFTTPLAQLGLGAALGGAVSNLVDHLRRGFIRDFLHVGPWPAFNLADVAIVGGLAVALGGG